ncbi:MAG: glycoside hydrolase family 99-like domain-containing protein, partial [Vallitaleaceae bacterium]|nr:glycoside hydrolase family 99-like domain-containing protein [Vallitaleaceae bacterium]
EMPEFPFTSYAKYREICVETFEHLKKEFKLPFYPNVTMGWDSSPRTIQTDVYDNLGYPFTPILEGNTPEEFKKALVQAKEFLDQDHTHTKILTINAWNEWTEGSYLEPDEMNGYGYLEAIKAVFVK